MRSESHEVRWILAGDLRGDAPDVEQWFREGARHGSEGAAGGPRWPDAWRDDVYLVLPGVLDLGVKWRDDPGKGSDPRLEFKGRSADLGVCVFGGRTRGRVERWIKWSYADSAVPRLLRDPDPESVVRVRKKRILRSFALEPDTHARETSTDAEPTRGLRAELTRLEVDGRPHWTLGFEAFPHDAAMHADFERFVRAFLDDCPCEFAAEDSSGYAECVARVRERR